MASYPTKPKFIMLGKTYVGKSCLLLRLLTDEFHEYLQPTQSDFYSCKRKIGERNIYFDIWDTAGQERFKSMLPMYIRGSTVALVVFDVNDPLSLEAAIIQAKENEEVPILALVANKADLLTNPEHDPLIAEARKQADQLNINFFITSAKTGLGVSKMFDSLALAAAKYLAKPGDPLIDPVPGSNSPSRGIGLLDAKGAAAPSFSCWGRVSNWWGSSSSNAPTSDPPQ